ncbi:MAG: preprotein translocase subunit YajC [Dehalococcoidia bacterium]|nr:preprotein translocase subunit YajC [Dehalococcoidia bacterium]
MCLLPLTTGCVPTDGGEAGGSGGSSYTMLIFIVAMFAMMYFLMIRPQRKKQKEQEQMQESLHKGDNVVTTAGIYGVIERIGKESIVLRIESGASIRVSKNSIAGKLSS